MSGPTGGQKPLGRQVMLALACIGTVAALVALLDAAEEKRTPPAPTPAPASESGVTTTVGDWTGNRTFASTTFREGAGVTRRTFRLAVRCTSGARASVEVLLANQLIQAGSPPRRQTWAFDWGRDATQETGSLAVSTGQARMTFGPTASVRLVERLATAASVTAGATAGPGAPTFSLRGSGAALERLACIGGDR